jgi:aminoglycoside 3-N-acetyltransferase
MVYDDPICLGPSGTVIFTGEDIRAGIRDSGLSGIPVCAHTSLRSFGHVRGGADAVVRAFLEERCTLMVPSFSSDYGVPPPPGQRFPRNGWDYETYSGPTGGLGRAYSTEITGMDRDMGAVPAAVVAHPGHERGDHPLDSFSAVGPLAADLVAEQRPLDVYAPLRSLAEADGSPC